MCFGPLFTSDGKKWSIALMNVCGTIKGETWKGRKIQQICQAGKIQGESIFHDIWELEILNYSQCCLGKDSNAARMVCKA